MIISIYYFAISYPRYTMYNIGISFLGSCLTQVWSIILLNAIVKGVAAPTSAVSNTNSLFSTLMIAVF